MTNHDSDTNKEAFEDDLGGDVSVIPCVVVRTNDHNLHVGKGDFFFFICKLDIKRTKSRMLVMRRPFAGDGDRDMVMRVW